MSHGEALTHLRAGRPGAAAALLESQSKQLDAEGWFMLGACRHALNDLAGAAAAFRRSLECEPKNLEAHLAHVTVIRASGDSRGALAASKAALGQFADHPRLLYAAAVNLEDLEQYGAALAHYNQALEAAPGFEDALHNKGLLLARLGRLDEAEANQRRYIAAHPNVPRAYSALADTLLAMGTFEEAMQALSTLERLAPQDVSARIRRGVALASLQRYAEARIVFDDAQARDAQAVAQYVQRIAPGSDLDLMLSPENLFFWQSFLAQGRCDWASWDACIAELRRLPEMPAAAVEPAIAFMAFHLPLSGVERHAIARHIAAGFEAKASPLPPLPVRGDMRIRVGVLSPDLREHLNAYLLLPLFELLDRRRFELYAYSLAAEDGSAIRGKIRVASDVFQDFHATSDEDAAARIRQDNIDLLIDAGGHTTGARFGITSRRPAVLQVAYLGFPGSLASTRVDYAIVDAVVACTGGEWTEELVRLPGTYFLYDFRDPTPDVQVTRSQYGLASEAFIYCAFHKAEKITPDAFSLWLEVLGQVPHAVLWLLALPETARCNLRRHAVVNGVDPDRLIFAPYDTRQRYLARQRLGDLFLDAVHHSAMTTACDALAAGLPVLTMRGSAMSSRAGESLLRAAGMPDLVAPDRGAFVRIAVELAQPTALSHVKARLARNRKTAPLFDTAARVDELGQAFERMMERAMRGDAPRGFDL